MDDIYENIEEYKLNEKRKILLIFDYMIADMLSNKKHNSIVSELSIRVRKLNISLVFITQSYFAVPKDTRLRSTHHFITKIPNKQELQKVAFKHSLDIDFRDLMDLYKKCTSKPHSYCANLASHNSSCFRKNLLEKNIKANNGNWDEELD